MDKLYEKPENPKEIFAEMLKDSRIKDDDLARMNSSIDQRAGENKPLTVAELKNLALRAESKSTLDKGKQEFMTQMQTDVKKFCEDNEVYFSKRQYAGIMKRAEASLSPLEVRQDLYKVAQVNNMTAAFEQQLNDNEVSVSKRFTDKMAQELEQGQVPMSSVQKIMDKTVERVLDQKFEIERNVKDVFTDFSVNGNRLGNILEDKTNGLITVSLESHQKNISGNRELFSMIATDADKSVYETSSGQKMSRDEAVNFAEKSLLNAINTYRVINAYQDETIEYIDRQKAQTTEAEFKARFQGTQQTADKRQKLEENLATEIPQTQTKEESKTQEIGGICD